MSGSSLDRRATFMGTSEGQANSSSTPCAACKLLRRRCVQDCPFSPYFSPHEPQKFACVHKVFGASNVSKMLMEVPESQRADAASSLVYEAKARIRDPVYGCMGTISALQQQAQSLQTELNAVRREIMRYKHHENNIAVADAPPATASAMMVSGYQRHNLISDRGFVVVNPLYTQTTASDFYNVPSCNKGATPGLKERRYW